MVLSHFILPVFASDVAHETKIIEIYVAEFIDVISISEQNENKCFGYNKVNLVTFPEILNDTIIFLYFTPNLSARNVVQKEILFRNHLMFHKWLEVF